jgi:hypothetical protein
MVRNVIIMIMVPLFYLGLALQFSVVQSWLAHKAAGWLSYELNTQVAVKSVGFDWGLHFYLEDLDIWDQNNDSLIHVHSLVVEDYSGLFNGNWQMNGVVLKEGSIHITQRQDSTWNYDFIADYFNQSDTTQSGDFSIKLSSFKIENTDLHYHGLEPILASHKEINVSNLFVTMRDIELHPGAGSVKLEEIQFETIGQLACHDAKMNVSWNEGEVHFSELNLKTTLNELSGDVKLLFAQGQPMQMELDVQGFPLNLSEFEYIVPALGNWKESAWVNVQASGNVDDIQIKQLDLGYGAMTRLNLNGELSHITEKELRSVNLMVKNVTTNRADLNDLVTRFDPEVKLPNNLSALGLIQFEGVLTGKKNTWRAYGDLYTDIGDVKGDMDIDMEEMAYSGFIVTENFDLGAYYQTPDWGAITAQLDVEGKGFVLKTMQMDASGVIDALNYHGYTYRPINIEGSMSNGFFKGAVNVSDPNAQLSFDGLVDFNARKPKISCDLIVDNLNFKTIGLFPDLPYSALSGEARIDMEGLGWNEIEGGIELNNVIYCANSKDYVLDYLSLNVERHPELKVILNSDIAMGELSGSFNPEGLWPALNNIMSEVVPNYQWDLSKHEPQNFTLNLEILDFSQIGEAILGNVSISQNAILQLRVDESQDYFEGLFSAKRVEWNGNTFHELLVDFKKPDEFVYASAMMDSITGEWGSVPNVSLDARSEGDVIYSDFVWGNDQTLHKGDVGAQFSFPSTDAMAIDFYRGDIRIVNDQWSLYPGAQILKLGDDWQIKSLTFTSALQSIALYGTIGKTPKAPLMIAFSHVNFQQINAFLPEDMRMEGVLDGTVEIDKILDNPDLIGDLSIADFGINDVVYGDICLKSQWVEYLSGFELAGGIENEEQKNLSFEGMYFPYDTVSPLDLDAEVHDLDLQFLKAFIDTGVILVSGQLNGLIHVSGVPEDPQLTGYADISNGGLYVDYLGTQYQLKDRIWIEPDRFVFDQLTLKDHKNNEGQIRGYISHEAFGDWNFNLLGDLEREPLLVLNTTEEQNGDYYGKAYATGNFKINGDLEKLNFDIALKTQSGTKLNMPMASSGDEEMGQFIQFVKPNQVKEEPPLDLSGISLNIQIDVTPDAELSIIFDEAVGDVMRGRGQGHLTMGISKLSTFDMYGQIEIVSGNYLFTLANLINKDFSVQPGGTISWYGSPYNAELKLSAVYKVNASLSDILVDANQTGQRVPVDLLMNLTGKMLNPNVAFDIKLPSVDPMTRSRFEAAVSNEQEKNRQAFSLLVLRQFMSPPNIVKSADAATNYGVAANTTELLSSQISNWLSQISDDFNLGFNYRSGDQISNEEIALALSTQFFDNRVQLSGNFGVSKGNANNQQPSNYIGDVKVEYLLTKDGKLKLMVYNESNNYRNITTQQSPYTQGVGLVYQQDFNHLKDLLNSWFRKTNPH